MDEKIYFTFKISRQFNFCDVAIQNKHWNLLRWLLENKFPVDSDTLLIALNQCANLDILKDIFYEADFSDWNKVCKTAGDCGRYDFLEWLADEIDDNVHKIAWKWIYYGAIKENRFDIMKRAYSKYSFCTETVPIQANVFPPLYKWLQKQECVNK